MMINNLICASLGSYGTVIIIGVALVGFMAFTMFSNKKRSKQMNDMHTTLRMGDEIMTIGGIVGTVVEIHEISAVEKEFFLETGTGANKTVMRFDMRALYENRTRIKEVQAEAARQAEIERAKKAGRPIIENAESQPTELEPFAPSETSEPSDKE